MQDQTPIFLWHEDGGTDPHILNLDVRCYTRYYNFGFRFQLPTNMTLRKAHHFNKILDQPHYSRMSMYCVKQYFNVRFTEAHITVNVQQTGMWLVNCYTEMISKSLSLPSRPSSGLHVSRALGIVQLNMSSIHWHVLSHVESWNFRPLELTRFSRQFVPERASCSLSGTIKSTFNSNMLLKTRNESINTPCSC
jgi:hypothetical protein